MIEWESETTYEDGNVIIISNKRYIIKGDSNNVNVNKYSLRKFIKSVYELIKRVLRTFK